MNRKKVTIVCCYNDIKQYKRLCVSLEKQSIQFELIGIDNQTQKFVSCSSALNSVLSEVKTEYVIFAHQDIELPEENMLEDYVNYLEKIDVKDILGVAGTLKGSTKVASHLRHGKKLQCAGEVEYKGLLECDTIDECFFGGRTLQFQQSMFDERLCDNWHLYAVEYCLRTRINDGHVWVCDIPLLHYSSGKINHAYNDNFRKIASYYSVGKNQIRMLNTVCGSTKTDIIHRNLFYWKREILFKLRRL